MKNLEQLRAAHALKSQANTTKRDVTKLPAMIVNNGLLAAAAFACETNDKGKSKRNGMKAAMDSVATFLAKDELHLAPMSKTADATDMIGRLAKADSAVLQRATAEALAYIGYLKRFATKAGDEEGGD